MSAQHVLDRLEGGDRPAELLALLGVVDGELGRRLGDAEQLRRRRAPRPRGAAAPRPRPPTRSPRGQRRDEEQRRERVERRRDRLAGERARVDALDAVGAQHEQRVEPLEVLDQHGAELGRVRSRPPTTASPRPRPRRGPPRGGSTRAGPAPGAGRARRTRAPRRRCRARRRPRARAGAARTRPSRASSPQSARVEAPRFSSSRERVDRARARRRSTRMPVAERLAGRRSSRKSMLRLRSPAARSAPGVRCRGPWQPRMRSAMMLRWICEVPAAIVSESDCIACSRMLRERQARDVVAARAPARPSRRMPSSPTRWFSSV